MNAKQLTPTLFVAPQISVADVAAAAAAGIRSIVNNRPDGEEPGQPAAAEIEAAAKASGLAYRHIPVVSGHLADADAAAMREALAELPAPMLAFCRSGTRSTHLWALSQAGSCEVSELLMAARTAGYDLAALAPRLYTTG